MSGAASEQSGVLPRPAQTATSIILGSLAILIFGIQPLLYAAFVGEGLIEPDRLGLLSAAEVIAIAIGSSLAIPALKHASVRAIAGLAILLVAAANYCQTLHGSADMLFVFRMAAGLGSGFLVGIAGMAIAATSRVGQWAAAYLLAQATSQFSPFAMVRSLLAGADEQRASALARDCRRRDARRTSPPAAPPRRRPCARDRNGNRF